MQQLTRALFLDRDGTINREVDYLKRPDDVELLPDAARAIREANALGFKVVIVTNQSGIARGLLQEQDLIPIHSRLLQLLKAEGASVDEILYCPHHGEHGVGKYKIDCDCRKPKPGMLLQAARLHRIDLSASFMVGDRLADIEAGRAAGCTPMLVLTGYGESAVAECRESGAVAFIGKDLGAVWDHIKHMVGAL